MANLRAIFDHQFRRLARIYVSRPVSETNINWHNRVGDLQRQVLNTKRAVFGTRRSRLRYAA